MRGIASKIEVPETLGSERKRQIMAAFDDLAADHAIELLIHDSPQAGLLLGEFQSRYGQAFEWWPFERPGEGVRALIARYDGAQPRTLSDFLGADHHRLTELWDGFIKIERTCAFGHETMHTLDAHHLDGPKEDLARFIFGLRRHIHMEEDLFFPVFDSKSGAPAGLTTVMRAEHREINAALKELEEILELPDCAVIIQTIAHRPEHPSMLFKRHDLKEERVLYPMADRILETSEVGSLIRAMQAV